MTVYVVVSYSGEYSDYQESIVAVCANLDRAKAVGRGTLAAYKAVTDWQYDERWKQYEMQLKYRRRIYGPPGCFIHAMELDESPAPSPSEDPRP